MNQGNAAMARRNSTQALHRAGRMPSQQYVFGPVPSRRLGKSLGINNIRSKTCTYDCIYCQVGPTTHLTTGRTAHVDPLLLSSLVRRQLGASAARGVRIDYLSFVPNGEPTLESGLATEIRLLRESGYRVAVFTNSSLLWDRKVREDLLLADYVSVKVDTVDEPTWKAMNRPHGRLEFRDILEGIIAFSHAYRGILTTETMLVKNVNDNLDAMRATGEYLNALNRGRAYVVSPVRPPLERHAVAPDPQVLSEISRYVRSAVTDSETLFSAGGDDFQGIGTVEEALLGILSIHPMSERAVGRFIERHGGPAETLERLKMEGLIVAVVFEGETFYRSARN